MRTFILCVTLVSLSIAVRIRDPTSVDEGPKESLLQYNEEASQNVLDSRTGNISLVRSNFFSKCNVTLN